MRKMVLLSCFLFVASLACSQSFVTYQMDYTGPQLDSSIAFVRDSTGLHRIGTVLYGRNGVLTLVLDSIYTRAFKMTGKLDSVFSRTINNTAALKTDSLWGRTITISEELVGDSSYLRRLKVTAGANIDSTYGRTLKITAAGVFDSVYTRQVKATGDIIVDTLKTAAIKMTQALTTGTVALYPTGFAFDGSAGVKLTASQMPSFFLAESLSVGNNISSFWGTSLSKYGFLIYTNSVVPQFKIGTATTARFGITSTNFNVDTAGSVTSAKNIVGDSLYTRAAKVGSLSGTVRATTGVLSASDSIAVTKFFNITTSTRIDSFKVDVDSLKFYIGGTAYKAVK